MYLILKMLLLLQVCKCKMICQSFPTLGRAREQVPHLECNLLPVPLAYMTCSCFCVGNACTEDNVSSPSISSYGVDSRCLSSLFCSRAVWGKRGMTGLYGSSIELHLLFEKRFHPWEGKKKRWFRWVDIRWLAHSKNWVGKFRLLKEYVRNVRS